LYQSRILTSPVPRGCPESNNAFKWITTAELIGEESPYAESPSNGWNVLPGKVFGDFVVQVKNDQDLDCGYTMQGSYKQ
jgi:hypothetical protein